MGDFLMPSLGADMESGTLVEWKVKVGDRVKRGDLVAVVETVKGAIDVEIFEDGVITELVVQPGAEVPVGAVLARLDGAGEPRERPRLSPRQRKLQAEQQGEPQPVTPAQAAPLPAAPKPMPKTMREAIGAAMARSKREIPHYYLQAQVDVQRAVDWLRAENEKRAVTERVLPAALLLKACALALQQVPELNGTFRDGAFTPSPSVHLGVAVSLKGGGLVAPAIHDAQELPVSELMAKLLDVVGRARSGRLTSSELSDGTITVTNLGDLGVDTVLGVIYPPQVAIVGLGKIVERPWVREGRVVPRQVVAVSLSADHRVSDGHRGGVFLSAVDALLQKPEAL